MRPIVRSLIFLLMWIAAATPCLGGTLAISSRTTLTIFADRIRADVFAENKGSQPAYGVRAHFYMFGRMYSSDALDQLGAAQQHTFGFSIPLPADRNGEFPFVGEVVYHDDNRMPTAALSADTLRLGISGGGLLSGRAPELTLNAQENLYVEISSRDPAPREVLATLYLPRGLTTPQKQKQIRLKPFETATVDFPLTHRYGIGSATYPVFCTLTYRDAGAAHGAVVRTVVRVKDYQNWFVQTRWYWLGAGVLILLGWAWIGATAGKRERADEERSA